MLRVKVPEIEAFDNEEQEFFTLEPQDLELEHSLSSISRWESKWKKPFLSDDPMTQEESVDYIRCMTLNEVDPRVYGFLSSEVFKAIDEYISDPMTATTFSNHGNGYGPKWKSVITSEIVYYWMASLNIPFECDKWHFNRLITLIQVSMIKNSPPKKMSKSEVAKMYSSLNASRREKLHSKG